MSDLRIKQKMYKNRMTNRHQNEKRRFDQDKRQEIDTYRNRKDEQIESMRKQYKDKILGEEFKLSEKLRKIRSSGNEKIRNEKERYERTISDLEQTHSEKYEQMELSFEEKSQWQKKQHEDHLDEQYRKYKTEREKYKL